MQVHKRTRTDKKRHTYASLPDITIDADIWITQPEVVTLVGYHTLTNGDLPVKNWDFKMTAMDASTSTLRIGAKLTGIDFVAPENGGSWFHLVLTTTSGVVSVT